MTTNSYVGAAVFALIVSPIVFVLLINLSPSWRVSSPSMPVEDVHPAEIVRQVPFLGEWLNETFGPRGPVVDQRARLGAVDALVNGLNLALTTALLIVGIVAMVLVVFGLFVYSIVTADWGLLGTSLLLTIVLPFLLLLPPVVWLVLLFQPCTPAYALTWLIIGLPMIGAGAAAIPVTYGGTVVASGFAYRSALTGLTHFWAIVSRRG